MTTQETGWPSVARAVLGRAPEPTHAAQPDHARGLPRETPVDSAAPTETTEATQLRQVLAEGGTQCAGSGRGGGGRRKGHGHWTRMRQGLGTEEGRRTGHGGEEGRGPGVARCSQLHVRPWGRREMLVALGTGRAPTAQTLEAPVSDR